ncbi:hypothetical protein Vafri_10442 [Volvox africanus]|uniref:Uncharacterized protein n=1 Tax=Volvox africanus TaxID=51714 RepID=A0A8J4F0N9_9CHLO|nr:hypothetical protein Vafri_10442 [Volvox africanus]
MVLNIQRQIEQFSSHYEQKFGALEQQLEGLHKEHAELSVRIQEDNQGGIAKAMHEDRLLAYVPEAHIADMCGIITEVIRQERPGTDIIFSIAPRPQKQGGSETAMSAETRRAATGTAATVDGGHTCSSSRPPSSSHVKGDRS